MCTCTCASRAASARRRSRPARAPRRRAASPPCARCPTRTRRWTIQRRSGSSARRACAPGTRASTQWPRSRWASAASGWRRSARWWTRARTRARCSRAGYARVYPVAAVALGQGGGRRAALGEMVDAGAVAISDDGRPVGDAGLMRLALEYAQTFGIPVANHCEELSLSRGGSMNEGLVSTRLGLQGIPNAAEDVMIARDLLLAELTGGRLHIQHVSTRRGVEMIRA